MIESVITVKPFRFWCQKVLPLVYDDSLSYYELLCKVVDYINGLLTDDTNVITQVNELTTFVNDYFTNLDVQEEINNKLDVMVENGQLDEVISHYVDPYIAAQNTRITNFETTVNEQISAQDNDIDVLEARMDTFASLPSGGLSTDGDAELADIRVGAEGETYSTAGNAVRGQVSDLKSDITFITGAEPIKFIQGYYIKTNATPVSLTPTSSGTGMQYAIIDCSAGDVFTIKGTGASTGRLWCFVDTDNEILSNAAQNVSLDNETITAPTNAVKCILNGTSAGISATVGKTTFNNVFDLSNAVNINDVFDATAIIENYAIGTDGARNSQPNKFCTPRIPLENAKSVTISRNLGLTAYGHAFYALGGEFISFVAGNGSGTNGKGSLTIPVPSNAKYIAVSGFVSQLADFHVFLGTDNSKYTEFVRVMKNGIDYGETSMNLGYKKRVWRLDQWHYGDIGTTNGNPTTSVNLAYTDAVSLPSKIRTVLKVPNNGYSLRIRLFEYSASTGEFIGYTTTENFGTVAGTIRDTSVYRAAIRIQQNGTTILVTDPKQYYDIFDFVFENDAVINRPTFIKSFAHQGGAFATYPNTLPAIQGLTKYPYDGIELDVRWTSDNVPVISHDLERTDVNGVTVNIGETTYAALSAMQFYADATVKIPSLKDALLVCKVLGIVPELDMKGWLTQTTAGYAVNVIKTCGMTDNVVFRTGADTNMTYLRNLLPKCTVCYSFHGDDIPSVSDLTTSTERPYNHIRNALNGDGETFLSIDDTDAVSAVSDVKSIKELGYKIDILCYSNDPQNSVSLLAVADWFTSNYFTAQDVINQTNEYNSYI